MSARKAKPPKRPRKRAPVHFVDVEGIDWSNFYFAIAWDVETGEEWIVTSESELADLIVERGGQWLAHFGGGYDHLFALHALPKVATVIPAGSRVLSATWHKKRAQFRATLRDTWPLWNKPLAEVGAWVGFPKLSKVQAPLRSGEFAPLDPGQIEQYEPSAAVEYCRRDVEIGVEAIRETWQFLESYGLDRKWTSGGAAVGLFQKIEPEAAAAMEAARISARDVQALSDDGATRGGRVEVFWYGPLDNVYKYDIKSSYPYSFCEGMLPIGLSYEPNEQPPALFFARWRRYARHVPAPVLGRNGILTNRGSGELRAWVTPEELEDLQNDPDVLIDKVERTLYPEAWIYAGESFARTLYAKKQAKCPYSKVFLNSLHGKFSQRPMQIEYAGDGDKYLQHETLLGKRTEDLTPIELGERLDKPCPWHYQPLAAATVFGRARSRLYRAAIAVQNAGGTIYYSDTDSLHCDLPPEKVPLDLGKDLGQWDFEGEGPACYLAPKLYHAAGLIRARGISRADEILNFQDYLDTAAAPRETDKRGTYGEPIWEVAREGLSKFARSVREGKSPFAEEAWRSLRVVATGKDIDADGRAWYRI